MEAELESTCSRRPRVNTNPGLRTRGFKTPGSRVEDARIRILIQGTWIEELTQNP